MTRILKIGLIGAGRWGPNLLGSLRRIEGVEIKHVADKSKEAVQNLLTKFEGVVSHNDANSLMNLIDLDGIVLATPVETHLDLVEQALKAGKHVFVEKPFGKDISGLNSYVGSKTTNSDTDSAYKENSKFSKNIFSPLIPRSPQICCDYIAYLFLHCKFTASL